MVPNNHQFIRQYIKERLITELFKTMPYPPQINPYIKLDEFIFFMVGSEPDYEFIPGETCFEYRLKVIGKEMAIRLGGKIGGAIGINIKIEKIEITPQAERFADLCRGRLEIGWR